MKIDRPKLIFYLSILLFLVILFFIYTGVRRYSAEKSMMSSLRKTETYRKLTELQNKLNDFYIQRNFLKSKIGKINEQIIDIKANAGIENLAEMEAKAANLEKTKRALLKQSAMLNAQIKTFEKRVKRITRRLPKRQYSAIKDDLKIPDFEGVSVKVPVSQYPDTGVLYMEKPQKKTGPDEQKMLEREKELSARAKKLNIQEQLFYSKLDLLRGKINELKALGDQLEAKDLRLKIRGKELDQREIELKAREKIYDDRMANYLAMLNSLNTREKALAEKSRSLKDLEQILKLKVEGFTDAKEKLIEMANKIAALEDENRFLRAKLSRTEPTSRLVRDLIHRLKAKELSLMEKEDALYRKVQIYKMRENDLNRAAAQFNLFVDRYNRAVSP